MAYEKRNGSALKIVNYIGGALIFFGVAYFIQSNWYQLNNFLKIFTTLGVTIAALIIGIMLHLQERYKNNYESSASAGFFMLSGLLLPIGLFVTFDIYQMEWALENSDLTISIIGTVLFLALQLIFKRTILLLFAILYASVLFSSIIQHITAHLGFYSDNLYLYEMIVLGCSYIFLGYYLDVEKRYPLTGILYFLGALQVLIGCFFLEKSALYPAAFAYWKILSLLSITIMFILAVPLRSKAFVFLAAIFLIIYIGDLTYQFALIFGNLGWSFILVASGLLLMVLGYLVMLLLRKFKNIRLD